MLSSWDYDGQFLSRFPQPAHNVITQLFLRAIRDGQTMPLSVIARVKEITEEELEFGGWPSFLPSEIRVFLESLDDVEAQDFAAFLLERESLSPEEKARLKSAKQSQHVAARMTSQPPTEKQINYLKKLGCKETPTSKAHASQLIDACLRQKEAV